MDDEEYCAVVCDSGSGMIKAGFAGDDAPRTVFPCVVGWERHQGGGAGWDKAAYVGDYAEAKRGRLDIRIRHPMEGGLITNWDDMEKVWHHTWCNELRIAPEEHPFLMTESPMSPKLQREKVTQIMFERFNAPKFYLISTSLLVCYASGSKTGVVLESGDGATTVAPIYEGYQLPTSKENILPLTGSMLTDYLRELLSHKGHSFTTKNEELVRDMKEKLGYVAMDYNKELVKAQNTSDIKEEYSPIPYWRHRRVTSPEEDKPIAMNESRFQCCEPLFNPKLIGIENKCGIDEMIYDAVMKCDADIRGDLFSHIVVAGGNTAFQGVQERLELELSKRLLKPLVIDGYVRRYYDHHAVSQDVRDLMHAFATREYKIFAPPERKYSAWLAWLGGSILASLSTFEEMWITKEEYQEHGPSIVQRKCLI